LGTGLVISTARKLASRSGLVHSTQPSVTAKILAILGAFTADTPELTLTELSRRTGLSMATAHRRAAELVAWGALEKSVEGFYRIGLRLWEVAALAPRAHGLRDVALPFMEDLFVVTRQNVQLAVREGHELVFVERIAGRGAVPVLTRVGSRFTLHATGVGLVLLAHAPTEVQEAVLTGSLPRYTAQTLTDPAELRRTLARVRELGYAISDRMVTEDALSVAAPIVNSHGQVQAALSLVVTADDAQVRALVQVVRTAARGISRALGMPLPSPASERNYPPSSA
jgi:DNA-binding IclR family transcriptional regulator